MERRAAGRVLRRLTISRRLFYASGRLTEVPPIVKKFSGTLVMCGPTDVSSLVGVVMTTRDVIMHDNRRFHGDAVVRFLRRLHNDEIAVALFVKFGSSYRWKIRFRLIVLHDVITSLHHTLQHAIVILHMMSIIIYICDKMHFGVKYSLTARKHIIYPY